MAGSKQSSMVGRRYGRLRVEARTASDDHGNIVWACVCDCGATTLATSNALNQGATRSCGCLARESTSERSTTHGECRNYQLSAEYVAWRGMRGRCLNPKSSMYAVYGGRGIQVCAQWESFEQFLGDMGRKPGPDYSIDRIDNDGNYEPGNCRWATKAEQSANTSQNVWLTAQGLRATMSEWSRRTGIKVATLSRRYRAGWDHERIVSVDPQSHRWSRRKRGTEAA